MPTEIIIQKMFHRGQWRMALYFAFIGSTNERIKQIGGRTVQAKTLNRVNILGRSPKIFVAQNKTENQRGVAL